MKRKTLYIILGIVIVGAVAGVAFWRSRRSGRQEQALRSAVVERGSMVVNVSASGDVRPRERVDLTFETGGEVAEVPVAVGDRVQAGDALVRLDAERLERQVEQAKAKLASAQAQLEKLRSGPQPEEIAAAEANVSAAEARLSAADAEREQVEAGATEAQIAEAEANLASALTEHTKAKDLHDRTMECFSFTLPNGEERDICPGLGPLEEQARFRLQAADASLEAARARLDDARGGPEESQLRAAQANVWAAAARRDSAQAQLDLLVEGATEEQIASAEARVAQSKAALEQARLSLEQAALEAPFGGIVGRVDVVVGEKVSAGMPAVTLVDTSDFYLTIGVDEMDVGQLRKGQTARVTLDALPGTVITGTVERIAPAASMDGGIVSYDVVVDLMTTEAPIRADMTATAAIVVKELTDVLQIPSWAVLADRETGQTYVNRRVGGKIERVDVKLGPRYEGYVQVLEGLSEGDEVVRLPESGTIQFEGP